MDIYDSLQVAAAPRCIVGAFRRAGISIKGTKTSPSTYITTAVIDSSPVLNIYLATVQVCPTLAPTLMAAEESLQSTQGFLSANSTCAERTKTLEPGYPCPEPQAACQVYYSQESESTIATKNLSSSQRPLLFPSSTSSSPISPRFSKARQTAALTHQLLGFPGILDGNSASDGTGYGEPPEKIPRTRKKAASHTKKSQRELAMAERKNDNSISPLLILSVKTQKSRVSASASL